MQKKMPGTGRRHVCLDIKYRESDRNIVHNQTSQEKDDNSMTKRQSKSIEHQKIAIGVGAVFIIGLAIYLSTLVVSDIPMGEYEAGVHYENLENPRRLRGDKIEVMEVFSYACAYCYGLEPDLADWVEDNQDKIKFVRVPAISNDSWRILARGYYAVELLDLVEDYHLGVFHAFHDKRVSLNSVEKLARYFDGKGTTAAEFTKTLKSPEVARMLVEADNIQRRYRVASVPTIIVNGKYRVKTTQQVGRSRILGVVDYLVEKELAEK
jgi:thiol:disulfide interchange protein DsbA